MAVVVAVSSALLTAPFQASAADPTRVLVVGDSVTHGLDGEYSWRYFSWKGLQQTGATVDFVGPSTGTALSETDMFGGSYADVAFDQDHAAYYGRALWQMVHWPSESTPRIEELVADQQPDVLVEMLGFNDLAGPWAVDGADVSSDLISNLRLFVERARSAKPDVDIVLGTLPQVWFPPMASYNDELPRVAAELSTPESRVAVTPVAEFVHGLDTYDDAHPTTLGQRKIAAAMSTALEQLGIGREVLMPDPADEPAEPSPVLVPEDPVVAPPSPEVTPTTAPEPAPAPAPTPHPAPDPTPDRTSTPVPTTAPDQQTTTPVLQAPSAPRRVRAVRHGRRASVTWRRAAVAEQYVVRCGVRSRTVSDTVAWLRTTAGRCKVRSVNSAGTSAWVKVPVRE